MYELLKQISASNEWMFQYGRRDFNNLFDEMQDGEIHIFLDPIKLQNNFDDFNTLASVNHTGSFMMVVKSEFDQLYNDKYVENIKPIIEAGVNTILEDLSCHPDYSIILWNSVEVINILDANYDGIIVNYNLEEDKL